MSLINTSTHLDELDLQILDILIKDCRTPYLEIARICHVSGGTIHVRMKKMEDLEQREIHNQMLTIMQLMLLCIRQRMAGICNMVKKSSTCHLKKSLNSSNSSIFQWCQYGNQFLNVLSLSNHQKDQKITQKLFQELIKTQELTISSQNIYNVLLKNNFNLLRNSANKKKNIKTLNFFYI